MTRPAPYDGIVLTAPFSVPYQRFSPRPAQYWIGQALRGALAAAGLGARDIDGLTVSSFTLFPDTAPGLADHLGLVLNYLDTVTVGGACGVTAMRRAARAVAAGDADIVACTAGDANDIDSFRRLLQSFSRFAMDASYPYGAGGPNAVFALLTDHYMQKYGATREQFGAIAVAQRANAAHNPRALMRSPLTLEDYLGARMISDPLGLFDCVMPCAGAEAFLVMTEDRARALGLPFARILSAVERHNAFPEDPAQYRGGWAENGAALWAQAGIGPADVDLVQTYDDYPVICAMQIEDLGFCPKGEGAAFMAGRDMTIGGDFAHNVSGGQLSAGQAGAAGGFLGLTEAIRQVTGRAGPTQVRGAGRALISGFGMVNYDRGICSAAAVIAGNGT
ncbi:MAG: thiolase family protein [Paracoccus sp. (in: a-proteobacteria)]|nr:thiolase family protein [Paracoccus sp. (in: a-proteobacteria)]